MAYYYVNKNAQSNGDHEVHTTGCSFIPAVENRTYLGDFNSCGQAVTAAKKIYAKSDGCAYCASGCHTS